jgi:SAM-dependent methyltransferase
MFLRKSRIEPLSVTMSAVRMGERVLQVGLDDPALASTLAGKAGLSGSATIVVTDDAAAERARHAAAKGGVLVDVRVSGLTALPCESATFDIVIAHNVSSLLSSLDPAARLAAMREWHRALRPGGRVMSIESVDAGGLRSLLRKPPVEAAAVSAGSTVAALEAAGFRPVRMLAEREGFRFIEGIKT